MWQILREAWAGLSATGRATVLIVLGLAVAGLIALAMWLRYDLSWLPPIIGGAVGG